MKENIKNTTPLLRVLAYAALILFKSTTIRISFLSYAHTVNVSSVICSSVAYLLLLRCCCF